MEQDLRTFVDAVTGRHVTNDPQQLLQLRRVAYRKEYGYCYDCWPEQPSAYALSGANGRFSMQAVCMQLHRTACEVASNASRSLNDMLSRSQQPPHSK
mmetsp:Transcript_26848/g.58584  ORF Transcript_26848/g.58584 Transcript_26848/m.58584 type:complete len:98 (-) Transcript_26848:499-792(-)